MEKKDYDAIVVGSGPNGLSAAITLQQRGLSVLLLEARNSIGGGMRTEELTLPGFYHDVCAAILPMAATSPFLPPFPYNNMDWNIFTLLWQPPTPSRMAALPY
ncbi:FAD-dependent oxidoreductase [Paraflavitalea speifideaquila]|uniref:FAD-dependent oxidoreductase n=1 Tax=Paraflavitalea speifideaquila TaxID=3076558 RepID=UPI0028EB6FAE|nr:FAD-dependent oxidoreductase [Paraflavitalea speifideiaquila]